MILRLKLTVKWPWTHIRRQEIRKGGLPISIMRSLMLHLIHLPFIAIIKLQNRLIIVIYYVLSIDWTYDVNMFWWAYILNCKENMYEFMRFLFIALTVCHNVPLTRFHYDMKTNYIWMLFNEKVNEHQVAIMIFAPHCCLFQLIWWQITMKRINTTAYVIFIVTIQCQSWI